MINKLEKTSGYNLAIKIFLILFNTLIIVSPISGYASNQYSLDHWMMDLCHAYNPSFILPNFCNNPINNIIIPGTHDSGSYNITYTSELMPNSEHLPRRVNTIKNIPIVGVMARNVIANWAKTQKYDINGQLTKGSRYLDLRVYYDETKDDFFVVHTMVSTTLREVLTQAADFLSNNHGEILLLDFNHFYNISEAEHKKILTMLQQIFNDKAIFVAPTDHLEDYTLANLTKDGVSKIVVFYADTNTVYENQDKLWAGQFLPDKSRIDSPFANTPNIRILDAAIMEISMNPPVSFLLPKDKEKNFFVLQEILTPNDFKTIAHSFTPWNYNCYSNLSMADNIVNSNILRWTQSWIKSNSYKSIVIVDSFDDKIAYQLIEQNLID